MESRLLRNKWHRALGLGRTEGGGALENAQEN